MARLVSPSHLACRSQSRLKCGADFEIKAFEIMDLESITQKVMFGPWFHCPFWIFRPSSRAAMPAPLCAALGYRRYWLAEHHNMPGIASAATAVAIGHVASRTSTIRVGAGGIMLPNHAPLVIAEQFGTL